MRSRARPWPDSPYLNTRLDNTRRIVGEVEATGEPAACQDSVALQGSGGFGLVDELNLRHRVWAQDRCTKERATHHGGYHQMKEVRQRRTEDLKGPKNADCGFPTVRSVGVQNAQHGRDQLRKVHDEIMLDSTTDFFLLRVLHGEREPRHNQATDQKREHIAREQSSVIEEVGGQLHDARKIRLDVGLDDAYNLPQRPLEILHSDACKHTCPSCTNKASRTDCS